MTAVAGIGGHLGKLPEFANLAAFWTGWIFPKPGLEKMIKTGIIIRELLHEFKNGVCQFNLLYP